MGNAKAPAVVRNLSDMVLHTFVGRICKREGPVFGLMMGAVLGVQAIVLSLGFVSVSIDEYTRVLLSASWARSPSFMFGGVWLPGHFYLLGLALKAHYDLFLTPRIFTMVFSLAALGTLYLLARKLFSRWVAVLSVLTVGLLPAYVYVSLTPLVDVVYLTFIIGFLYLLLLWSDSRLSTHLIMAALMLGLAASLRYEAWFSIALFGICLGSVWLKELWTIHSLHIAWLTAIGLACLPPCVWLVGTCLATGDPLYFLTTLYQTSAVGKVGPLTDIIPHLAYVELLLQNQALVCLLAVAGIALSHWFLSRKIWLHLVFGLAPLVVCTFFRKGTIGTAYRPRYVLQYFVVLAPFCAYAIYRAITARGQSLPHLRHRPGCEMLLIICVYNLWVVYLGLSQRRSGVLICLLTLAGTALSYPLVSRKHWFCLTLSHSPLPVFLIISRIGSFSFPLRLYTGLYFVLLALFYASLIWRATGAPKHFSRHQWWLVGLSLMAVVCLDNLWGSLLEIPQGMPDSANQVGWRIRQFFEEGVLAENDKVLVEVDAKDCGKGRTKLYKAMQVMSNHPGNFILDRAPFDDATLSVEVESQAERESFMLDKSSLPHEVGAIFGNYEPQINPFSLDPPLTLDEYLKYRQIRMVVLRDPRLEALLVQQTGFEQIGQVGDYFFYCAAESR